MYAEMEVLQRAVPIVIGRWAVAGAQLALLPSRIIRFMNVGKNYTYNYNKGIQRRLMKNK
jgi:hypothetical protein